MRILYLAFAELDVPTACRTRVVEMIRHLTDLGHQMVAILPKTLDRSNLPPGARSICLKWSFSFLGKFVFQVLAALVLLWQGIRWKPHVIYEREMECNPFPTLVSQLLGTPLIIEINGVLTEKYQRHRHARWLLPIVQWFQRVELRGAAAITIPSDFVRDRLIEQYQLDPQKVKFIYNGVNTDRFFPQKHKVCRDKCGLPEKAFMIGFVGYAFTWYDLMTPLRALSVLLPQWPDMELVIVGDGPTRQPVQDMAAELGLANHLRWMGFQPHDQIPDWINSFDSFLLDNLSLCGNRSFPIQYILLLRTVDLPNSDSLEYLFPV